MNKFYEYLFHYNDYTGLWAAFKDADRLNYLNKRYPHVGSKAIFSKNIKDLFEVISQGGFPISENKTIYQEYGLEEPK